MQPRTIQLCGFAVALGAIAWSWGWLQAGVMPEGVNDQVEIWMSGLFQLGLVALLAVMRATDATGDSRWGRFVINAEIVALALAMAWTVPFAVDANRPHTGVLVILDAFWPLSMLGLVVVGVQTVRARRWPKPARYLPLAASLLLPVDIVLAVFTSDEWTQTVFRSLYLAGAYTLLGVAIVAQVANLSPRTTDRRAPAATRSEAAKGSRPGD